MEDFTEKPYTLFLYPDSAVCLCNPVFPVILLKD